MSQRYWKISSSSFEVEAKPPPPLASPLEIGGASTSQDLKEIFQYLLDMPRPLSQSPLVIVDLLIVDSLVLVDRLSRPNGYFSLYFSRNTGFSRYSVQFAADGRIHYYERRLY